jgi:long-chain acyl-CoA synthetase
VVLISQGLEHIVRPLARHLGVTHFICNRLDFRDGYTTGRLLKPVIHSRGGLKNLASRDSQGGTTLKQLSEDLGLGIDELRHAVQSADEGREMPGRPVVLFEDDDQVHGLSVRDSLAGKHILLIGGTGFIGKVWLAQTLEYLPEIGRVHLLIRRQRSVPAVRRFEYMMETSPIFDPLQVELGSRFERFVSERVTILEGDSSRADLGLEAGVVDDLRRKLDVVINSGGLTDFNPDLRNALSANVESTRHVLEFVRSCDHAALLHLSTAFVVGRREGRIDEELRPDYVPRPTRHFDVDEEEAALQERVRRAREWPPDPELVRELAMPLEPVPQAPHSTPGSESNASEPLSRAEARATTSKSGGRFGWMRRVLTEIGTHRAQELGWPNSYVFTKSMGESLLAKHGSDVPIAIVRPSIVESSHEMPFPGWNEGINTSAPLSYLLGTTFRQLPANERKCLDVIPVDLVCRGMTLIAAALVERCHQPLYQLATSVSNPCDMERFIELTSLAHRQYYGGLGGARSFWKMRMDAIPVSRKRYRRLSAPRHMAIISRIRKWISPMPFKVRALARVERAVARVAKLVEIYEPFILEDEHVFEAENIRKLSAALPPEECAVFGYDPGSFNWRDYWINVHIPALRRWCYPLIEGRSVEQRQRRSFRLQLNAVRRDEMQTGTRPLPADLPHRALGQ